MRKIRIGKGFRELLREEPVESTPLTKDMLEKYMLDIFANRKRSTREKVFSIGEIYPGMYRLHDGTITGKSGWDMYNEALNDTPI